MRQDQTAIEIHRYRGCHNGQSVTLVKVIGDGYTWPGGRQYLLKKHIGPVSLEINASELMLDFFLQHQSNGE